MRDSPSMAASMSRLEPCTPKKRIDPRPLLPRTEATKSTYVTAFAAGSVMRVPFATDGVVVCPLGQKTAITSSGVLA